MKISFLDQQYRQNLQFLVMSDFIQRWNSDAAEYINRPNKARLSPHYRLACGGGCEGWDSFDAIGSDDGGSRVGKFGSIHLFIQQHLTLTVKPLGE